MCVHQQAFDLANWSMTVSGTLPIKVGGDGKSIDIDVVRGDPIIDTSGSGEVAGILNSIGLLKIFQNIDTSLRVNLNFDFIPTVGRLLSITVPTDQTASPILLSANWTRVTNAPSDKFSPVGIAYVQSFGIKEHSGCLVAKCLRSSADDEEFTKCVLLGESAAP